MSRLDKYPTNGHKTLATISKMTVNKLLKDFGHHLDWPSEPNSLLTVVDAGCGDGYTTFEAIYPVIDKYTKELILLDKSDIMLKKAEESCTSNKAKFMNMDVGSKTANEEMTDKIDKLFSFDCVHTVPNPKVWLGHFYRMLQPGGQLFMTIRRSDVLELGIIYLSLTAKWRPYIFPYKTNMYFTMDEPISWLRGTINYGFEISHMEVLDDTGCRFQDLISFREFLIQVMDIPARIPPALRDGYIEDYIDEICKLTKDPLEPIEPKFIFKNQVLLIIGTKRSIVYKNFPYL